MVQLHLSVAEGQGLEATVESVADVGLPVLSCRDDCEAGLPAGRYRLTLHSPDNGSDSMHIHLLAPGPAFYRGAVPDVELKYVGVASLISGGLLALSGITALSVTVLPWVLTALLPHGEDSRLSLNAWGVYGLVATPAGIALAIFGLITFKANRRPFVQEVPTHARGSFGIEVAPGVAGLTGTLRATF